MPVEHRKWWRPFGRRPGAPSVWSTILPDNLDVQKFDFGIGLREGVGCAIPVLVGEAIGYPVLAWAAVAAFYACLADPGGRVRVRLEAIVALGVFGSLSCGLALWASERSIWLVIPLCFLWSFASTYVRVYGEAAQKVGLFVLVTFAVASGSFSNAPVAPFVAAAVYAGGVVWAIVLTLGIWPIDPHGPSRRAIGTVYDRLSDYAGQIVRLNGAFSFDDVAWGAVARKERHGVREALDAARSAIARFGRAHIGKSRRGDEQLMLLQCADQIFASLIALNDYLEALLEVGQAVIPTALKVTLDGIPEALDALSKDILAVDNRRKLDSDTKVHVLLTTAPAADETPPQKSIDVCGHLIENVLLLMRRAAAINAGEPFTKMERPPAITVISRAKVIRLALLAPLRDNFTVDSIPFRHALRLAVAATLALFISLRFELVHGYWLMMTVVLILQPYLGMTWQITVKRIVFSSFGGILAAILSRFIHTPLEIAFIVFPLSIATMMFRTVDYGLFVMFLTPQFVLISSLADPLNGELSLAWARAFDSILGGIITVGASFFLWPSHQSSQLPGELGEAIAANRQYFARVLQVLESSDAGTADASRRIAGLQSNNAEASLERVIADSDADARFIEAAMTAVSCIRQLTGSITLLSLMPHQSTSKITWAHRDLTVAWIGEAMQSLVMAAKQKRAPELVPSPVIEISRNPQDHENLDPVADVLKRIVRQLERLRTALTNLAVSGG